MVKNKFHHFKIDRIASAWYSIDDKSAEKDTLPHPQRRREGFAW